MKHRSRYTEEPPCWIIGMLHWYIVTLICIDLQPELGQGLDPRWGHTRDSKNTALKLPPCIGVQHLNSGVGIQASDPLLKRGRRRIGYKFIGEILTTRILTHVFFSDVFHSTDADWETTLTTVGGGLPQFQGGSMSGSQSHCSSLRGTEPEYQDNQIRIHVNFLYGIWTDLRVVIRPDEQEWRHGVAGPAVVLSMFFQRKNKILWKNVIEPESVGDGSL